MRMWCRGCNWKGEAAMSLSGRCPSCGGALSALLEQPVVAIEPDHRELLIPHVSTVTGHDRASGRDFTAVVRHPSEYPVPVIAPRAVVFQIHGLILSFFHGSKVGMLINPKLEPGKVPQHRVVHCIDGEWKLLQAAKELGVEPCGRQTAAVAGHSSRATKPWPMAARATARAA